MIAMILLLAGWYWIGWIINSAQSKSSLAKIVAKESRMVWLTKEKFYGQQIIRRNIYRRKGEVRKKKVTIKGFSGASR